MSLSASKKLHLGVVFVALLTFAVVAVSADDQPAAGRAERQPVFQIENFPEGLLQDPQVAAFGGWLAQQRLDALGLRVDSVEFFGQLMLVRMKKQGLAEQKIDDARSLLVAHKVTAQALTADASERAVREWLERASAKADPRNPTCRALRLLGQDSFGVSIEARWTPEQLTMTQLSVLRGVVQGATATQLQTQRDAYVRLSGYPEEAFEHDALVRAAVQETARRIAARPANAAKELRRAKSMYGLDPVDVFALLPLREGDFAEEVEGGLKAYAMDPRLDSLPWPAIRETVIRPEEAQAIIDLCTRAGTADASRFCAVVLQNDTSEAGREWLYAKLLSLESLDDQRLALVALNNRGDFSAVQLEQALQRTQYPRIEAMIFRFAERALGYRDVYAEAQQFLVEQAHATNPRHRALAIVALLGTWDAASTAAVAEGLESIRQEADASSRAEMIRTIARRRDDRVIELLLDLLRTDPEPEVRGAVAETVFLAPTFRRPGPGPTPAALREAAENDSSPNVRSAAWQRLMEYDKARREHGFERNVVNTNLSLQRILNRYEGKKAVPDVVEYYLHEAEMLLQQAGDRQSPDLDALRATVERLKQAQETTDQK